jgi:class 3 adenylate cyclase
MAATRRLAAILAADVAGYSRLMGADEEAALIAFAILYHPLEKSQHPSILTILL